MRLNERERMLDIENKRSYKNYYKTKNTVR